MGKFKRVSLEGSEELFRPTKPQITETRDTITEIVHAQPVEEKPQHTLFLTIEEIDLLLEAIQTAKYPERARGKVPLFKHERFDEIRAKLRNERSERT
jgi:hypothetical protein